MDFNNFSRGGVEIIGALIVGVVFPTGYLAVWSILSGQYGVILSLLASIAVLILSTVIGYYLAKLLKKDRFQMALLFGLFGSLIASGPIGVYILG